MPLALLLLILLLLLLLLLLLVLPPAFNCLGAPSLPLYFPLRHRTPFFMLPCVSRENIESQNFVKNSIRVFDEPGLAKLWEYMDGIKNDITREEKELVAAAAAAAATAASAAATAAAAAPAVTPDAEKPTEGSAEKCAGKSSAGKPKKGARRPTGK